MAEREDLIFTIRTEESEENSGSLRWVGEGLSSTESFAVFDEFYTFKIQQLKDFSQGSKHGKRNLSTYCLSPRKSNGNRSESRKSLKTRSLRTKAQSSSMTFSLPPSVTAFLRASSGQPPLVLNEISNRALGAMLGFVIGDSIGSHLAHRLFDANRVIEAIKMPYNKILKLNPGQGTDETQIMLSTAEGLVACGCEYNYNKMARKYLEWFESTPFDLPALIAVSLNDIRKAHQASGELDQEIGQTFVKCSRKNEKNESSLGLIRVIPLALWGIHFSDEEFVAFIRAEMKLITPNQFAVTITIAYAKMLRCIIRTGDSLLAYHEVGKWVYSCDSLKMKDLWSAIQQNAALQINNHTSSNVKVPFFLAVNQLIDFQSSQKSDAEKFIDCLCRTLERGFNTDTTCSIVMGLIGARVGHNQIPTYFRKTIFNSVPETKPARSKQFRVSSLKEVVNDLLRLSPAYFVHR